MLTEIRRYPVKSCGGELLSEVGVEASGVVGDRTWAVVDTETGLVASAKHPRRWGPLLTASASLAGEDVEVRLPDGRSASFRDSESLDELISSLVGWPVSLRIAQTIEKPTLERTDPDVDLLVDQGELELGDVVTGALSTASPPGTVFDFAPVHIISTVTLEALEASGPTAGDPRRFRPNLVVDIDGPAFQENDWPGRTLHLGADVVLDIVIQTPRCVVPTLAQADIPRSVFALRSVALLNRIDVGGRGIFSCVGVYATVQQTGIVTTGDRANLAAH